MKRELVPVIPLPRYWRILAVSPAQGKKILNTDPDFPRDGLVQIGVNRLGMREDRGADYQQVLQQRAAQPRPVPVNLRDPKAAAAKSVEVRRAKAAVREAEKRRATAATPGEKRRRR